MVKYPESVGSPVPLVTGEARSLEEMLDRGKRHVNECVQCQQVRRACIAGAFAGGETSPRQGCACTPRAWQRRGRTGRRAHHSPNLARAQGMATVTRLCAAVSVAAAAAFSSAWGLLAAALVKACPWSAVAWPLVLTAAAALLLGRMALGLWEFREETFVSGVKSWKRRGGFALVKMPDVA